MATEPEQDLLADLTPAQRRGRHALRGPLLILAGAGSGKTRVITPRRLPAPAGRAAGQHPGHHLHQQGRRRDAPARRGARARQPRLDQHLPQPRRAACCASTPTGSASTAISPSTIRTTAPSSSRWPWKPPGSTMSASRPTRIAGAISKAKNQLLSPERYAEPAPTISSARPWPSVYPIYEKRLRDANALDFDDLLFWPALALKHDAELRAELDARFRFVLIDEYQDTNQAQYAIARGLSLDHPEPVRRRRSRPIDL